MADEPQVSDEQVEATKLDKDRKRQAGKVPIAADQPGVLEPHQYTERDPLTPQPEPDANPLVPNIERPSRSRSEENVDGPHRVSEVTDVESTTVAAPEPAQRDDLGRVLPEDEQQAQAQDEEAAHQARVEAGRKAAETRKANEEHEKRVAAGRKAAQTRAKNERKK